MCRLAFAIALLLLGGRGGGGGGVGVGAGRRRLGGGRGRGDFGRGGRGGGGRGGGGGAEPELLLVESLLEAGDEVGLEAVGRQTALLEVLAQLGDLEVEIREERDKRVKRERTEKDEKEEEGYVDIRLLERGAEPILRGLPRGGGLCNGEEGEDAPFHRQDS